MYFFFVGVCNYNQLSKNIVLISKTMYIYMVFTFIKKNKKYVFFLYCLLYILRITSVVQKSLIYDSLWVDFKFLHRSQVELRTGEVIQNYCFLTSRSTSNARKLNSKELSCQSFFFASFGISLNKYENKRKNLYVYLRQGKLGFDERSMRGVNHVFGCFVETGYHLG
jgi:hypothetical protein